jgi:hypothetical protein
MHIQKTPPPHKELMLLVAIVLCLIFTILIQIK